jgi:hypothetical protein
VEAQSYISLYIYIYIYILHLGFFFPLRSLRNNTNAECLFFFNIHAYVHPEWDKYMLEKGVIV